MDDIILFGMIILFLEKDTEVWNWTKQEEVHIKSGASVMNVLVFCYFHGLLQFNAD